MGNSGTSESSTLQKLLQSSNQIGKSDASPYGAIIVVEEQQEQGIYAEKVLSRNFSKELLEKYRTCECNSLTRMVGYFDKPLKGLCVGRQELTTAIFEFKGNFNESSFQMQTLSDELEDRKKSSRFMSQQLMVQLLRDTIEALLCLDKAGIELQCLRSDMLLLAPASQSDIQEYVLCPVMELFEERQHCSPIDLYCRKLCGQSRLVCQLGLILFQCFTHKSPESFLAKASTNMELSEYYAKDDEIAKALVANKIVSRDFKSLVKKMICQKKGLTMTIGQLANALSLLEPQTPKKQKHPTKSPQRDTPARDLLSPQPKHLGFSGGNRSGSKRKQTLSTEEQSAYILLRRVRESYLLSELFSPRRKHTLQP